MVDDVLRSVAANLRRLRAERGRSLSELARASGVGKATLSALEAGRGNPTIETLSALASALGVPTGDLLAGAADDHVTVVRAAEGAQIDTRLGSIRLVQRMPGEPPVEIYDNVFEPGASRVATPHAVGTREHVYVMKGRLRTGPVDREVDLKAGDLASFAADVPHVYEAGPRGATALLLMQGP